MSASATSAGSFEVAEPCGLARGLEPLRIGVPLPRGAFPVGQDAVLADGTGRRHACQLEPLARWPDGSVQWALVEAVVPVAAHARQTYRLEAAARGEVPRPPTEVRATATDDAVMVDTGAARIELRSGDPWPLCWRDATTGATRVRGGLRLRLAGHDHLVALERVNIERAGPLRSTAVGTGRLAAGRGRTLLVCLEVECVAGSGITRVAVLLHNPTPARHGGGLWDLGDRASVDIEDCSLLLRPASTIEAAELRAEPSMPVLRTGTWPWLLHQDSSGGEHWDSPNHVDRANRPTVRFRGYRVSGGDPAPTHAGQRATPELRADFGEHWLAVAVGGFWEEFPKALRADAQQVEVGLFPRESAAVELQGGERKRHVAHVECGRRPASPSVGARLQPVRVHLNPEQVALSGAVAWFVPESRDANLDYLRYVGNIIEGPDSFFAKREAIDEYGWRHFGDVYADHEAVRTPGTLFPSHYNNQYDFVLGALQHFLRSGDCRWWQLGSEAAKHVLDIDLYHTQGDRAAFNGGLFWHTDHYYPAATATHRTYSARNSSDRGYGGGPSNEHNYTSGLLQYHLLTGDRDARDAVIGLADWVLAMDDGARTLFALFDASATGDASKTASNDYHRAGRGAGNSINALLDAFVLAGERRYLDKAEALIRRCIHPDDDVAALKLDEPERRWSYLVFLQMLGKYLELKSGRDELDFAFEYARSSLLRYAAWMLEHERPYYEWLDRVLIPTETWPAHDVRKCHVLHLAAAYAPRALRAPLRARAREFFSSAVTDVQRFPTARVARPLVILCVFGVVESYFANVERPEPPPPRVLDFGVPEPFVPQRARLRAAIPARMRLVAAESRRMLRDRLPRWLRAWI
ncbi:MAG: hypothetical protein JSR73_11915 [Proteobacteria bacterium]|nr:hypothetical protein [Pseudomonadota bacterium]